ncbi:hypothetical protein VSU01S_12910 [Vibrio superstes NBRC 103154]|uniref:DUF3187 family protein n=2 Tax=Vibrio superstes TaxID=198815 RepID=A0A511QQ77_9VIBR|nr:hypothetical protein VSU01S_12910 [Vibrio superstes NBRC 103154]
MTSAIASVWAQSNDYQLDYYQNQVFSGVQIPINKKFSAEVMLQYSWAGNNHLDSLVAGFHNAFGLEQNGRDEAGDDQFNISSSSGSSVHDFEGQTMAAALHSYLSYQFFETDENALSIGGSLYYNHTDNSDFSNISFEQGLQLNYSHHSGRNTFFGTLGATHRKDDVVLDSIPVRDTTVSIAGGYSLAFLERYEAIVEYHYYQGMLDDGSAFSEPSKEFILGFRGTFDWAAVEISATENMGNKDNSTDIYFTAGLRFYI